MEEKPADFSDIDSINNLDTARMALRWALERLRVLEKNKSDVEKNTQELDSLRAAFQVHLEGDQQKELYFRRMEDLFASFARGNLDAAQLEKRRSELDSIRHRLASETPRLEEEFSARRSDIAARIGGQLEAEFGKARKSLEDRLLAEAQDKELASSRKREDDFSARQTELRQAQIRLDSSRRSIEEKEACLQTEHEERRKRQEAELERAKKQAAEESRARLEEWEHDRAAREAELAKSWALERDALTQKAKTWEGLSRAYLYHIMELQESVLRGEMETFQRMQALEAAFGAGTRELKRRKDLLDKESAEREKALSEERSRMLAALHDWSKGLEEALTDRSGKLDGAAKEAWERWTAQEVDRAHRDQEARQRQGEIAAKYKQIEDLRLTLKETIEDYRRKTQNQGNQEKSDEHDQEGIQQRHGSGDAPAPDLGAPGLPMPEDVGGGPEQRGAAAGDPGGVP